jgi:Dyp-type peroxidase family
VSGRAVAAGDPADELEPVLPLDDIQGNVIPGFNKRHQRLLGLRISDLGAAKRWLARIAPEVTTAAEVQRYKELRRELKARRGGGPSGLAAGWTNLALSAPALRRLVGAGEVDRFEDEAFKVGLFPRAALLGDPDDDEDSPGSPRNWTIGGSEATSLDVLVVVAADVPEMLQFHVERVVAALGASGAGAPEVVYEESGGDLPDGLRGHEHFGFKDGLSQPGIRGRLPWDPKAFLVPRLIAPDHPMAGDLAQPGQPLIRVGQFLFGWAGQDRLLPREPARRREGPAWADNGSFLVFRRLRQDVAAFRGFLRETANELRGVDGLEALSEEHLGALLVGRWASGAPLMRASGADDPRLGADRGASNDFLYDQPSPAFPLLDAAHGDLPPAPADPDGLRCPIWAHIRKVNPRDITTDQGSSSDTLTRRVLRRGIPYGPAFRPGEEHAGAPPDRGLLFLSYQTSIADQFEFLASTWMNDVEKPQDGGGGGHDLLVGQNPRGGQRRTRTASLRTSLAGAVVAHAISTERAREWVIPTGGGYFFAPSLSALVDTLAR